MQYKWIIIGSLLLFSLAACNNSQDGKAVVQMTDSLPQKKEAVIYTCPMHHQIRENAPGKCPICGMTLVPLDQGPAQKNPEDTLAELRISSRQQLLAGIHTDTAQITNLSSELMLTATTLFNPKQQDVISARVNGWIEKMYVRNPGEEIFAGQRLYELYSPDLLSAEKDYLLAIQQKGLFNKASVDFTATIQAMKQKLLRWGLSQKQIDHLQERQPTGKTAIYSESTGYLIQKMKEEGGYVKEGEAILSLAENNTLWVQAQLYDQLLPLISKDTKIWVQLAGSMGQKLPGKIVFDNPVNEPASRVHLVNIEISNPGGNLQPGMLAYVHMQTSKGQPGVAIPKSSVIYGQDRAYVWVKRPDSSFERREVTLGQDNTSLVAVLQGVKVGESVVSSGVYLLNSEYILKNGSGANLSGMQMSDMKMSGRSK
ncbi:efflux RND transporter periplasmic adaptor subunit [Arachidicoccus ginsenosidivorans]|jgi:Cu(I)/Ag(I) efflux system membrane fusion protein|uniref:Membrane fusion protein, Cu(I)/Ag(I) efflux system n=2 Tax=Arachidicoccus TaxID=1769012 RepID=A0A1H4CRJ6_9BACT|nr:MULTISPECIES: efflux RND transporter periplasmic adaptor subunit [Arachidicoccus]QEC71353.1 efflux RND transporter periplasmic adaptor subunit [Arachidicoccus ginsenosidivorans]SEA63013.1 membrane fusion protein, Cu(I)/Ag(I) efflux system [Arachidicoccus rhizosphaerae]